MDLELTGRRALVTASTAGIGAEIARRLAAEGCAVLVHGRNPERARSTVDELRATGATADLALGDLTDDTTAADVAHAALDWGVDVLVCNAGPFAEHHWDSAEPGHWLDTLNGNVVSAVRLIRPLLTPMRAQGWGRIITIGSRAATTPLPNMVDYSAAKAAVVNLTTSLAAHLTGTGITANTVSPGVIVTDGLRQMFLDRATTKTPWHDLEPQVTAEYAPNPTGRLGTAEDIAAAVAFLASPLAGYINGIDLRVDGGITGVP